MISLVRMEAHKSVVSGEVREQNRSGSVSKVEMMTPMALIYMMLFPSISTFETPPPVVMPRTACSTPGRMSPPPRVNSRGHADVSNRPVGEATGIVDFDYISCLCLCHEVLLLGQQYR